MEELHGSRSKDVKISALHDYHLLSASIKQCVRALKKLQYETLKIDVQFCKELFQQLFSKRRGIVARVFEPNDEECDWSTDDEDDKALEAGSKDIPNFWLETLQNISLFGKMVQEHDRGILKHLVDVEYALRIGGEAGFTLEFYFSPNIIRAKDCVINWNPAKNVTVKLVKKVQKRKIKGAKRTVTKSDEDTELLLESDFKLGQFLRERVIPRAVLYFFGKADDSKYDDDDGRT
ncbi:unnamed protein product [Trichobilharzia regenti]|nr:unnamed protein product [Trichobilharzia regenti]